MFLARAYGPVLHGDYPFWTGYLVKHRKGNTMPQFNTIPKHMVEIPRSFTITLTDNEAREFTHDLQKIVGRSEATQAVIEFMASRNN